MSRIPNELFTVLIVTTVTVLIWFWAAGETLDDRQFTVQVRLQVPENWIIDQSDHPITIKAEGSKLALQNAEQALRRRLHIDVPAAVGLQSIEVAEMLRRSPVVEGTGLKILSTEPAALDVHVDEIRELAVRVRPNLPGVTPVGEVEIDPPQVTMRLPSLLRQRLPAEPVLEAFVDRSRLDQLRFDVPQSVEVRPRLPDGLANEAGVTMVPERVRLSFTMRSRVREHRLDSVRIHLAGPHEDHKEYLVELEEAVLRDVTVTADSDIIRRLEAGEATVVAVLHLSSGEKERRIESKRIAYFVTVGAAGSDVVQARVGDSTDLPRVNLRITRLATPSGVVPSGL